MPADPSAPDRAQPGGLRVFNSREETRNYHDRIARIDNLMADHGEAPPVRPGWTCLPSSPGKRCRRSAPAPATVWWRRPRR
jgi:hypothetical protein